MTSNLDNKLDGLDFELTTEDLDELAQEVAYEVDTVICNTLQLYRDDPAIIYAATICDEYGYFYFGFDDAFIYGLVPDEMHPAPWVSCKDTKKQTWSIYDVNNVQVAGNLSEKTKNKMIEIRQAARGVRHG